ncbi:MAG: hypothetical protein Q9165_003658 [Trypethelium subeluteriae]
MRSQRDRYDDYYDREVSPRGERNRWQDFSREKEDRALQTGYGAGGAMVPYKGDGMNDAYDPPQRSLQAEAYDRAFRQGVEDEEADRRARQRRHRGDKRGRRGWHSESEDSEDDREHRKRSKSRGAKGFLDNHFDIRSDMGLIAGMGGGLAGAALGRRVGDRSTYASVAGAIAGAAAANALENQWKKHRQEANKRLDKEEQKGDHAYGQDGSAKKESGKNKTKKDKK